MIRPRCLALFTCLAIFSPVFLEVADAHVGSGGNCAACHTTSQPNYAQISTTLSFKNTSPRKDTGIADSVALPMFEVVAGNAVDLKELVKATSQEFGVALAGRITDSTRYGTVSLVSGTVSGSFNSTSNKLNFVTDSSWSTKPSSGTNPKWYTQGAFSGTSIDRTSTYRMTVNASTPSDYYPLTFITAGGSEDWHDTQAFYLHVLPTVPEPSTFVLLGGGVLGLALWWRRKR